MSIRLYSKRPKSFTDLLINLVADIVTETITNAVDSLTESLADNLKDKFDKTTNDYESLDEDVQQTLKLINKKLEKKGLSQQEIAKKTSNLNLHKIVKVQMKSVQEQMCEKIKNSVQKNTNMSLESEEILEDNSIVLTINL